MQLGRMIKSPLKTTLRRSARLRGLDLCCRENCSVEAFAQVEQQGLNSGRESKKAVDGKTEHSLKPKTGNEKSRLSLKLKSVPNTALEDSLRLQGFRIIAGVDEAGRGPLAGPIVASACIIPPHVHIEGIRDSKQMTAAHREKVYQDLTSNPEILCATQVIEASVIDKINILQATLRAMEQAVEGLGTQPDFVLIDGNQQPQGILTEKSKLVIKGDSTCQAIAAASILAKVARDRLMLELDKQYPQYGFQQHKGYGTVKHMAALKAYGPCPIHRMSYKPVADALHIHKV